MAEELAAVEAALWGILEPYRARLEPGSVSGLATLKRAGASQHSFFAGVRLASHHVAFHLMPIYADPTLLDGVSTGLWKHLTGKTTFTFAAIEPDLFGELDGPTTRCFEAYEAAGPQPRAIRPVRPLRRCCSPLDRLRRRQSLIGQVGPEVCAAPGYRSDLLPIR